MAEIISAKANGKFYKWLKAKSVLVGGCFDVLHPGHIAFLEKAKKEGEKLIILLESDRKVRELKGSRRPIFTQQERAQLLSALCTVDFIVMLPYFKTDGEYDELIAKIRPAIVAASTKEANIHHIRAAKLVGAEFKVVIAKIGDYSSSKFNLE